MYLLVVNLTLSVYKRTLRSFDLCSVCLKMMQGMYLFFCAFFLYTLLMLGIHHVRSIRPTYTAIFTYVSETSQTSSSRSTLFVSRHEQIETDIFSLNAQDVCFFHVRYVRFTYISKFEGTCSQLGKIC